MPFLPRQQGPKAVGPTFFARFYPQQTSTWANDAASAVLTLSGSFAGSQAYADSRSITITLSGSATGSQAYADSQSGTNTLAGGRTDSLVFTELRSGQVVIAGSSVESGGQTNTSTDAMSGTLVLSGSSSEHWDYSRRQYLRHIGF